jgi:isoquinoline 1-oxidoreductase subunit beta
MTAREPKAGVIDRRQFFVAAGAAGLVLGFGLPWRGAPARAAEPASAGTLSAFLRIAPDGVVTIFTGRSEMGQGAFAGLATLVAEELDCDWRMVAVETGPAADAFKNVFGGKEMLTFGHAEPDPDAGMLGRAMDWAVTGIAAAATEQFTGGSSSIRDGFERYRRAGAVARAMLIAAAAKEWGVEPAACSAVSGVVTHGTSGRRMGYGELAAKAALLPPPAEVALKPRSAWTLIGRKSARPDLPAKIDGSAVFGIDVRRPGMLFAAVANCPVFGGRLKSFDATPVLKMPGVKAVQAVPGGLAVVADSTWRAKSGLAALRAEWEEGPDGGSSSEAVEQRLRQALDGSMKTGVAQGDPGRVLAAATRTITAEYRLPYLAHATMEPMNCTAEVTADGVDIWTPTQVQTRAVKTAADAAGVSASKVRLHTTYLGGGFGRRAEVDQIAQAVSLAKATGKPVQVLWSREEDMRHDFYRPMVVSRAAAALDAQGLPVAMTHRIAAQSVTARIFPPILWLGPDQGIYEGLEEIGYAIPDRSVEYVTPEAPVPVGPWRSVGNSYTAFIKECFLDEIAHQGGVDPVELRRRLLSVRPRIRAVLDLAAEKSGWGKALPPGQGRGIALHLSFGSIVAETAEVEVASDGRLKIKRIVAAVDCGTVINPDVVEAQIQGGVVFGLTAALFGKITVEKGRVREANFPDYEMLRLAQMPPIDVYLVASEAAPGGIGEPGTPPIAPALANAIFAATGKRIRSLPLADQGFTI